MTAAVAMVMVIMVMIKSTSWAQRGAACSFPHLLDVETFYQIWWSRAVILATREVEVGVLQIQGLPQLQGEFKASLGNLVVLFLNKVEKFSCSWV